LLSLCCSLFINRITEKKTRFVVELAFDTLTLEHSAPDV
jgi:hypothetical protein